MMITCVMDDLEVEAGAEAEVGPARPSAAAVGANVELGVVLTRVARVEEAAVVRARAVLVLPAWVEACVEA